MALVGNYFLKSQDYMIKILGKYARLKFQPPIYGQGRISKLAECFHISDRNIAARAHFE